MKLYSFIFDEYFFTEGFLVAANSKEEVKEEAIKKIMSIYTNEASLNFRNELLRLVNLVENENIHEEDIDLNNFFYHFSLQR